MVFEDFVNLSENSRGKFCTIVCNDGTCYHGLVISWPCETTTATAFVEIKLDSGKVQRFVFYDVKSIKFDEVVD